MAIAFGSLLTSNGSTGNNITTASITPTAGNVTIFSFYLGSNTGTVSVSGCNLTWTKISITNYSGTVWYVYWGVGASPTTGTITTSGGNGGSERIWLVQDFSGVDTTSPIVQSNYSSGSSATLSTTLGSAITSGNTAFGFGGRTSSAVGTLTAGSGFTKIGSASQSAWLATEYQLNKTGGTVVDMSASSSGSWGMIGLELKSATGPILDTGNFFMVF